MRISEHCPDSSGLDKHLAYGEAAFMLLDSLLLILAERGVLSDNDLLKTLETAISTKRQMVEDAEHPEISAPAAGLLAVMANSLMARTNHGSS